MKRPAVFFDRDNTLIACDEYLGDPNKVVLIDGAAAAVARARQLGYATVIFSNQSGVARGYFSEQAVHAVNERLDELLQQGDAKAIIDRHEFCPYHPDASIEKYRQESPLQKPSPGMIHQAADAMALDLSRSWVIGDAPRDIEAGHAAGCRTILFADPSLKSSPAALVERKIEPDYICTTLNEAMDFIERNTDPVMHAPDEPVTGTPASRREEVANPPSPTPESEPSTLRAERDAGVAATEAPITPTIAKVLAQAQPHSTARLESLANDILQEIRRHREQPHSDFSVSKLMAGVVQVIVFFVLFLCYLNRSDNSLLPLLIFALTMQTMTIALLIMGRQR